MIRRVGRQYNDSTNQGGWTGNIFRYNTVYNLLVGVLAAAWWRSGEQCRKRTLIHSNVFYGVVRARPLTSLGVAMSVCESIIIRLWIVQRVSLSAPIKE